MTVFHMGALHPIEQALTLALAFGPFVLLGGVVWWRRREDARAGAGEVADGQPAPGAPADREPSADVRG